MCKLGAQILTRVVDACKTPLIYIYFYFKIMGGTHVCGSGPFHLQLWAGPMCVAVDPFTCNSFPYVPVTSHISYVIAFPISYTFLLLAVPFKMTSATTSSTWEIRSQRPPIFQRGGSDKVASHHCHYCHIPLLTSESPGFCCGIRGSRLCDIPPLPPLPVEYDIFLNHPHISSRSCIFNLIFMFASMECYGVQLSFCLFKAFLHSLLFMADFIIEFVQPMKILLFTGSYMMAFLPIVLLTRT